MGGESFVPPISSTEEEVSSASQNSRASVTSGFSCGEEGLSSKFENGETGPHFEEFLNVDCRISSTFDAAERQRRKVYAEVVRSYGELQSQIEKLDMKEAKIKLLSYTPGSLLENTGGMGVSSYDIPKITSLLLIGPKGSGKSSLVNKISGVFENDIFASERAQVSFNCPYGEGTCFLHEYMIPRGSGSFCLYDTRSLSDDSSENVNMLKHWMTKGVRHGELVQRKSDSAALKARLNCNAREGYLSKVREINFVILVVNGLAVLESLSSDDEKKKQYIQRIASTFTDPLLSFKDDKPIVVVTHGDLLAVSDRARIRFHMGELLGIPPKQIFDIPDSRDPSTTWTIFDMLHCCLERADRNLPCKTCAPSLAGRLLLLAVVLVVAVAILISKTDPGRSPAGTPTSENINVEWHKIRHLWLGD